MKDRKTGLKGGGFFRNYRFVFWGLGFRALFRLQVQQELGLEVRGVALEGLRVQGFGV